MTDLLGKRIAALHDAEVDEATVRALDLVLETSKQPRVRAFWTSVALELMEEGVRRARIYHDAFGDGADTPDTIEKGND